MKVASATVKLEIANCIHNANEIINLIKQADQQACDVIVFPELSITAYTCGDLFHQNLLLEQSLKGLEQIIGETVKCKTIAIVGLPLQIKDKLYNCAAVINQGEILGVVPKTLLPNYSEFYEKRWFESSVSLVAEEINILGKDVPCGTDLIFKDETYRGAGFSIDICEDLWSTLPPSSITCAKGASVVFNLSASNELIGKYNYRKDMIKNQSRRAMCAYVYASSGPTESTSDLVFSGYNSIVELGELLSESNRFNLDSEMIVSEIDIDRIVNMRMRNTTFTDFFKDYECRNVNVMFRDEAFAISRNYKARPFVPSNPLKREERSLEIINIQAHSLVKRLKHTGIKKVVVGISGGLDSALAFLIATRAFEILDIDPKGIIAITMPGFGTTSRTLNNAKKVVIEFGATLKEIDIKSACYQHFKDIEHNPEQHDITYENTQARERTKILMNVANKCGALVLGTGDLSELALGWCTYNGDHMSMYAVNVSIPKTLVQYLIQYFAEHSGSEKKAVLEDILQTDISPELLPPDENGEISQKTEEVVGPYELHDFFLYHFLRYGATPAKIYLIANTAFSDRYSREEIKKWLTFFFKRFFTQQFKRNCMPDGPKVGTISLSPRGDLRMPSDASYALWMQEVEQLS